MALMESHDIDGDQNLDIDEFVEMLKALYAPKEKRDERWFLGITKQISTDVGFFIKGYGDKRKGDVFHHVHVNNYVNKFL